MTKTSSQSRSLPWRDGPRYGWFAMSLCLVAMLQSAALAWIIYERNNLIESGKEVILDIVPVDPRSLFRGDYVILSYGISQLKLNAIEGDTKFERGDPAFVTMRKPDLSAWQPVSVTKKYPDQPGDGQIVLRGKVRSLHSNTLWMNYGIEKYFVQEGHGKLLEQQVREKKLQVLVAIGDDGEAAIKGLLVDGKLKYRETLF